MLVFSGNAHPALAKAICDYLDMPLGNALVKKFPDGESDVKIHDDVRGADTFVVQPTCHPVNDSLIELLLLVDCLKRASADRITVVLPYYGYARKDRKDEGRVPITAKLVANLITTAGAHRVLAMDLHASQIQGFFDIPVDHMSAGAVLAGPFQDGKVEDLVVVSPDVGSVKLAVPFAKRLGAGLAVGGADRSHRRDRHDSAPGRGQGAAHHRRVRGGPARRGDEADSLQRIGQFAVQVEALWSSAWKSLRYKRRNARNWGRMRSAACGARACCPRCCTGTAATRCRSPSRARRWSG
jgi:phosphoribosylpyrophosphate synthetase